MQFLWFYIPGPENGYELKHSIRSVKQHFEGSTITVIGDKPSWYDGHFIPCPKIKAASGRRTTQRGAFLDTQHKIVQSANHPEIDEKFVWIMDDCFLLKSTTLADLEIPRYDPWYRTYIHREWHRLIQATFNILKSKNKPALQVGTHLPHVFEKSKLLEMFEIYDYPRNLYLFEILYGNHFRDGFIPYGGNWEGVEYEPFLKRILRRPRKCEDLEKEVAASTVLNYQSGCFSTATKQFLQARFPCE